MKQETKKQLLRFAWQLLSAILAAFGGTQAASAAVAFGLM